MQVKVNVKTNHVITDVFLPDEMCTDKAIGNSSFITFTKCHKSRFVTNVVIAERIRLLLFSRLVSNLQVGARLRGTSASGQTPVMDTAGGRDREPVTTPSLPPITLQGQVTLAAYSLVE